MAALPQMSEVGLQRGPAAVPPMVKMVSSIGVLEVIPAHEDSQNGNDVEAQCELEIERENEKVEHDRPHGPREVIQQRQLDDTALTGEGVQQEAQCLADDVGTQDAYKKDDDEVAYRLIPEHERQVRTSPDSFPLNQVQACCVTSSLKIPVTHR